MSNTNRRRTREHSRNKMAEQMDTEDELMMENSYKGPIRPNIDVTICRTSAIRFNKPIWTPKCKNKRRLIL